MNWKNFSEEDKIFLPKTKTELSRVAAEKAYLADGSAAAEDQIEVDSQGRGQISVEDR